MELQPVGCGPRRGGDEGSAPLRHAGGPVLSRGRPDSGQAPGRIRPRAAPAQRARDRTGRLDPDRELRDHRPDGDRRGRGIRARAGAEVTRRLTWFLAGFGLSMIVAAVFPADPIDGFPPGTPEGPPTSISTTGLVHFASRALGLHLPRDQLLHRRTDDVAPARAVTRLALASERPRRRARILRRHGVADGGSGDLVRRGRGLGMARHHVGPAELGNAGLSPTRCICRASGACRSGRRGVHFVQLSPIGPGATLSPSTRHFRTGGIRPSDLRREHDGTERRPKAPRNSAFDSRVRLPASVPLRGPERLGQEGSRTGRRPRRTGRAEPRFDSTGGRDHGLHQRERDAGCPGQRQPDDDRLQLHGHERNALRRLLRLHGDGGAHAHGHVSLDPLLHRDDSGLHLGNGPRVDRQLRVPAGRLHLYVRRPHLRVLPSRLRGLRRRRLHDDGSGHHTASRLLRQHDDALPQQLPIQGDRPLGHEHRDQRIGNGDSDVGRHRIFLVLQFGQRRARRQGSRRSGESTDTTGSSTAHCRMSPTRSS